MHVLLVSKLSLSSSPGGAEVVIRTLCEGLIAKGHQVTFLSFDANGDGAVYGNSALRLVNHAPSLHRLSPLARWNGKIEALGADPTDRSRQIFERLVDQQPFDVVNTHQLSGIDRGIWRAAAERRLPVVHTIHDYYLLCPQGSMYRAGERCAKQCWFCRTWSKTNRNLSRYVGAVAACSQFVLDRHVHLGFFADSYRCVIHPASINRAYKSTLETSRPRNPLRLGFIGRLHRVKGLERLFEMLRACAMPSYELRIAGVGNRYYSELLKKKSSDVPVRWIGWLDREIFFSEIDILVVPSLWDEPAGLVISEAVHHGVPTLASDRGGLGEIARQLPSAYVFDPDDHSSFRLALDRAVARLGTDANLFPLAQPRYVEDLVDSYEALLRKATGIAVPQPGRGRFATRSAATSADESRIRQG